MSHHKIYYNEDKNIDNYFKIAHKASTDFKATKEFFLINDFLEK